MRTFSRVLFIIEAMQGGVFMAGSKKMDIVIIITLIVVIMVGYIIRINNKQKELYNEYYHGIMQVHLVTENTFSSILEIEDKKFISEDAKKVFLNIMDEFEQDIFTIFNLTPTPIDEYSKQIYEMYYNELYPLALSLDSRSSLVYKEGRLDREYIDTVLSSLKDLEASFDIKENDDNITIINSQNGKISDYSDYIEVNYCEFKFSKNQINSILKSIKEINEVMLNLWN